MSDIKEKPNPFTLSPKLWAKTSWTDKKNVDQFITEYEENFIKDPFILWKYIKQVLVYLIQVKKYFLHEKIG